MHFAALVAERLTTQLHRYQSVLASAKRRNVNESDTVVIVADMLSDMLGYDKYHEISTEHAIRGTYVDLAVGVDGDLRFLVEIKAIGIDLKETHVKQAIDYGANQGIEWVVLTNGAIWRVYRIKFGQPIDKTLICEIDIVASSPRDFGALEAFCHLSREGFSKRAMALLAQQRMLTGRFAIAEALLSASVIEELGRELERLSPGIGIYHDVLRAVLEQEVIDRACMEGDEARSATTTIRRLRRSIAREHEKRREAGAAEAAA